MRVARVCIDSPLPHLDRLFDYAVPTRLADLIAVGSRVRVPFAGRLVSAVVVELADNSDFAGTLAEVKSSAALPSYTSAGLSLARAVADRYGGSLWDVCRLMAPPRVASVEKRDWSLGVVPADRYADAARAWPHEATASGLAAWDAGGSARIVWELLPAVPDPQAIAVGAVLGPSLSVAARGRTALVVVPDARSIAALETALTSAGLRRWAARTGGDYAVLDHDDGPSQRYGSYLAAMRGHVNLVIGTRPVALQPVPRLGLVTVWDDGSSVYADPHAPYPHARTVAAMRADLEDAGLILAAYAPSVDAMALVEHGWAKQVSAERAQVRERTAGVDVLSEQRRDAEGGTGWHWMPGVAWKALRTGIWSGPVAVVVPRAGYVSALACAGCGQWAECRDCTSSLKQARAGEVPECVACGKRQHNWHCPECQGASLKQLRQGAERIAEQLRSMVPEWKVHASTSAAGIKADYEISEGLVVATPGALPAVAGGYAHAVIVGATVPAVAELGAELHALRWWINVAALVRSRRAGGGVTVVGQLPDAVAHALRGWLPAHCALDAYRERAQIGLPPARRLLELQGDESLTRRALARATDSEPSVEELPGVTVAPARKGLYVLAPRGTMPSIVARLRALQHEWSRTGEGELRLVVDGPMGAAR